MDKAAYISEVTLTGEIDESSYLSVLPAVQYLKKNSLCFERSVTVFVGENGTGKSTLLEAIAVAYGFNAEGGSRNFSFSTNQTHSDLWQSLTLSRRSYADDGFFLRAESLYNVATNIEELDSGSGEVLGGYGGCSLHSQSHGESFLNLVRSRFFGRGLYLLDEPEAALSPMRQLNLIAELDRLVKADSQIIMATHSPMLMAFPNADVIEFSDSGLNRISYADSEHFKTMKAFLNDPERMLHHLLSN